MNGDVTELLLRFGTAVLCGAIIGFERELKGKAFGLRTSILVALAAALGTTSALSLPDLGFGDVDPGRVIQGMLGAVGLLGAGAFLQREDRVRGATTGVGILLTGCIGIAAGLGLYLQAAVATAFGLFVLSVLAILERWTETRLASRRQGGDPAS